MTKIEKIKKYGLLCSFFLLTAKSFAQTETLAGQWRINMDVFQDGKINDEGDDMPAAACLLTIKQTENGAFEGTFSSSPLVNKTINKGEEQVEYMSQCPVEHQKIVGRQYGSKVFNALQFDNSNNQNKWTFNGLIKDENQIKGSFYGIDCFWGDFAWERVGTTKKVHINKAAAITAPVAEVKNAEKQPELPSVEKTPFSTPVIRPVANKETENAAARPFSQKAKIPQKSENIATDIDDAPPVLPQTAVKPTPTAYSKPMLPRPKTIETTKIAEKKAVNTSSSPFTPKNAVTPDGVMVHKVGKGETMYRIAHSYNMTVKALKVLNNIPQDSTTVKIGQKLKIR